MSPKCGRWKLRQAPNQILSSSGTESPMWIEATKREYDLGESCVHRFSITVTQKQLACNLLRCSSSVNEIGIPFEYVQT